MDITCGLVDKFRDLVLDLIWEQLLYLVHYHKNIEQLNEHLEELTLERSSIQHRIDEATNNVEIIEEKVLHWLLKVDEISEQVQKFHEEESQAKTDCSITSCPNPWLRYKLSKRAKAVAQEIAEICGKGNFNTVSYCVPPQSMPKLTNRESNEGIDSRVPIMDQIMEALQNPNVNMIGLCGLPGVGKTTIAKEVEKKAKNQKMFEKVIMATVSDELNVEKIQGQIVEKLGMQLNEKMEDTRALRLGERLKKEKNMLLILDDLWEELDLGKVEIPFVDFENYGKNNEGCKILLTSRNKMLLSDLMKCQQIIEVGVLLENEAWELFKRITEISIDSSSPLTSIATEIVRKCGGLPLAIATAAKALRKKDLNEWKDALARLNHPLRRNITGIKEVDIILKMSYNHLSLENKHIFLLSAMLSHDPSIEDLLMFSMGLDILKHIENMEEAYNGIFAIVSKLKSLNLFLDSFSSHHFTMHDVFRDVALSIAFDELNAFIVRHRRLKEWPDENMLEGCKGICLQESDVSDLPEELHGPRLEFFLLNSSKLDLTIPNLFSKSSKELKVMAFTNVHFSLLPSLNYLQKLKALLLHSCLVDDISEVRSLKNLKVLSLAYSEIQRLPIELAELTSLEMLNLAHCSQLKVIPQKLLSSLKKLEVLYMGNSFDQWKVEGSSETNENASLDELKDLPISSLDIHIPNVSMLPENLFLNMNLKRFRIFIGKRWEWRGNYETSKTLKLELERSIYLRRGVPKLLEEVEDLYLYGFNGLKDVLDSQGFPHLRRLRIESNDDVKYIVLNSSHHEATATNNISNKIFEPLFHKKVLLPKLEILKLFHLNSLIPLIWDDQLAHNSFSNLKTLIVNSCGFVKLVPLHVLKSLNNLEELEVSYCDKLEMVFDFEDLNYCKEIVSSSVVVPLKKIILWKLPKLKNVWSNHLQGNVCFQSLRSLDVSFCESLTSVFPTSIAKGMLHDLEELRINNCGMDVIVAKDQVSESVDATFVFPRLTSLQLFDLPNLSNFYPQRHISEWPHLKQLSIEYCDELEILEKKVSSSSEMYEEESTLDTKYPLLSHNKVIHSLEELKLRGKVAMIGSSQLPMYHFPKVKMLYLYVDKATTISSISLLKSFPNLEELELWGDFKGDIGGNDVATLAASFSKLTLKNNFNMISLEPSLVSSPHLTHLHVEFSHGLTTLMTSSTARSLVHLKHLSIVSCNQIDEIITKQKGEYDEDKEIIFSKLEFLKLDYLPKLKRFCGHNYTFRFPLLECVTIANCPQFTIFCPGAIIHTPMLQSVQLLKDWVKHQEVWDTNLNKTLFQQRYVESRELVLDENDVSMLRNDKFPVDHCPQVEILHIETIVSEGVTFPYTLLERFPQLNALHVEDSSFEEIFPSHAHIIDHMGKMPPFKELYLANLDELKNIWRDNSQLPPIQNLEILDVENCFNLNKLAPSSTSFVNLIVLKVSKCHQFLYLVTNSTAKSLVNLETLEINDCEKMEEIVRKETHEDVEGGITFNELRLFKLTHLPRLKPEEDKRQFNIEDRAANNGCRNIFMSLFSDNKVLLPKLEILELSHLNSLIPLIWGDHLPHNSFSNLKTLIVDNCSFVKLVPLHVLKLLNLEELGVGYCDMLEMVFDFEDLNDYKEMKSSSVVIPLKKLNLWELPKLKNVWSNCHQEAVSWAPSLVFLSNLTHLEVTWCHELTTLMTSSTAQSLVHLTHLSIRYCDQIEKIITKNEGEDDEDKEIFFNKLEFLELYELPRLKRFCSHNYTFMFLLLKHVTIIECPRFTMFCSGTIHTPQLQSIQVYQYGLHKDIWMTNLNNTIQHRFTTQEVISTAESMVLNAKNITMIMDVFPKVSTLYVESFSYEWVAFPYSSLERFPNLYQLYVEHSSFEEIFSSQSIQNIPPFDELYIAYLDKLKSIWKDDSQLPPIHQNLTFLHVKSCCNLINLAPSSASFQNLRELYVSRCHKLIYLVTSSTAKSLVSLEALVINDCEQMEEIVMNTINEDVEGGITFNRLGRIELTDMPSLKVFSSQSQTFQLPELNEVQITGCPQMKMFCVGVLETPKLSKVKIEEHDMEWKDEGDLNKTIQMQSSTKDSVNIHRRISP